MEKHTQPDTETLKQGSAPTCIYIAGPVTNEPYQKVHGAFLRAQRTLQADYPLAVVVNPLELNNQTDGYESCMANCLRELATIYALHAESAAIYLLPGWEHSTGAKIELVAAKKMGFQLLYHPDARIIQYPIIIDVLK
jgi:hypothetical protein